MPIWTLHQPLDLSTLDFLALRGAAVPEIRTSTHYRHSVGSVALDLLGSGFVYKDGNLLPFGSIHDLRLSDAVDTLVEIGDLLWTLLELLSYYDPLRDDWDEDGLLDYLFRRFDEIVGSAGADTLCGRGGDDVLRGNDGIDTALYGGTRADYDVQRVGGGWQVADRRGEDGRDTLSAVERLQFADGALALDLDGQAGSVARLIGALFGADALARPDYVGTGLALLGRGMSESELAALAAASPAFAAHAGGDGNAAFVATVFAHAVGRAATAEELDHYTALLDSGATSRAALALLAASTDHVAEAVDLVGLAASGLPYVPIAG